MFSEQWVILDQTGKWELSRKEELKISWKDESAG
jgi:hypothetical protein